MPVCDVRIVSTISRMLRSVADSPRDQSVHLRTQHRVSAAKSGLRDVKIADCIRYWRRSGLKDPDKPEFYTENREKSFVPPVYAVLAKIRINRMRINRGLLYFRMTLTTVMHCLSNVYTSCLSENVFSVMLFFLCLRFDMY